LTPNGDSRPSLELAESATPNEVNAVRRYVEGLAVTRTKLKSITDRPAPTALAELERRHQSGTDTLESLAADYRAGRARVEQLIEDR
jgi:hypothetical protein